MLKTYLCSVSTFLKKVYVFPCLRWPGQFGFTIFLRAYICHSSDHPKSSSEAIFNYKMD